MQQSEIQRIVSQWKTDQEKVTQEMHHKFSVQYNLLIADYKKLDRDLNEVLQEKLGLEEELREFNVSYINLQRQIQ